MPYYDGKDVRNGAEKDIAVLPSGYLRCLTSRLTLKRQNGQLYLFMLATNWYLYTTHSQRYMKTHPMSRRTFNGNGLVCKLCNMLLSAAPCFPHTLHATIVELQNWHFSSLGCVGTLPVLSTKPPHGIQVDRFEDGGVILSTICYYQTLFWGKQVLPE